MKRRKNVAGNRPVMATKRKAKREAGKSTGDEEREYEAVAAEAERLRDWEEDEERDYEAVAAEAERLTDGEEGTRRWSVVDEQMSWGSFWCPSWDIEYLGEAHNSALCGDIVWDYDIWDLGGINEVP